MQLLQSLDTSDFKTALHTLHLFILGLGFSSSCWQGMQSKSLLYVLSLWHFAQKLGSDLYSVLFIVNSVSAKL